MHDRVRFYQQLAVLARAGVPLRASLARLQGRFSGNEMARLAQGVNAGGRVEDAFIAAGFTPFECHLVAAGERRIIVPTIFRSNYLSGLKALSHNGVTRTLIRSLDFLQRYTLAVDFSTLDGAQEQLDATNAFRDAQQADAEGVRLVLP